MLEICLDFAGGNPMAFLGWGNSFPTSFRGFSYVLAPVKLFTVHWTLEAIKSSGFLISTEKKVEFIWNDTCGGQLKIPMLTCFKVEVRMKETV